MKNKTNHHLRRFLTVLCVTGAIGVLGGGVAALNRQHEAAVYQAAQVEQAAKQAAIQAAAEAARLANPTTEQLAFCKKFEVRTENCVKVYDLVKSGQPVMGINYFEQPSDGYGEFLSRQNQRKADLEYCAKNRTEWSCAEGQYKGQY